MASTVGPEKMVESTVMAARTAEDLPSTPLSANMDAMSSMEPIEDLGAGFSLSQRSHFPPPNPPFVFPLKPSSLSAPSSYSRATGRRPKSAIESFQWREGSLVDHGSRPVGPTAEALPDFSFNPGALLGPSPENAFLSPPQSPQSPHAIPSRPAGHGHRRGGSEFVGGKLRDGDAIAVMSTSPTKPDHLLASPHLSPNQPSRAKGHRHRRSAAMSGDFKWLNTAAAGPSGVGRGSSAPTSPTMADLNKSFSFPAAKDVSVPAGLCPEEPQHLTTSTHVNSSTVEDDVSKMTTKPAARTRVGFSETLEIIPRPLSLVSSDTSSTVTARHGGHSVSGSISSVISLSLERDSAANSSRPQTGSRPSTAGAVLEGVQDSQNSLPATDGPRRRNSIPLLVEMPPAEPIVAANPQTPSPGKTPKRWSFFGLDHFSGSSSPVRSRPISAGSSDSQPGASALSISSTDRVSEIPPVLVTTAAESEEKQCRPKGKKQKYMRRWTGYILLRKSKVQYKRRAPTPPPQVFSHSDGEDEYEGFALEPALEPPMPILKITRPQSADDDEYIQRPVSAPEDESYPMIDLDAALGPFNTPLPRDPAWEAAQRAGGFVEKKQLHSAARGRQPFHKRAESAPEFDNPGRFIRPFASRSTIDDVFEEDEEDDDDDSIDKSTTNQSTPLATSPKEMTADPLASDSEQSDKDTSYEAPRLDVTVLDFNETTINHGVLRDENTTQEASRPGLERSPVIPPIFQKEIISQGETQFSIPTYESPCDLTNESNSAAPSPRYLSRPKDLSPVEVLSPLSLPPNSTGPTSPYSATQSSLLPSPRSPMSYDAHRISTAPSSITEDNFQSLLAGEPGPEVRLSVDIPSLTSSNSTMTRAESIYNHNPQARQTPHRDLPRPTSLTSAAFGRRRSSLASLSRLIYSSHGERSKLSVEVPMDQESEKKAKSSKAKRLSRMMQFWKSKESSSA